VESLELLVLTSSLDDPDWPDFLDRELGVFTYYGDNKRPGRGLHETPRNGNAILRRVFDDAHTQDGRRRVPPILVFGKFGRSRDVSFLGLAVPGTSDLHESEDLVAIWRTAAGHRFQNYRARFTILDVPTVSRRWLNDVLGGCIDSPYAPDALTRWVRTGHREALRSPRSLDHRTRAEQVPADVATTAIVSTIHAYFADRPHDFEACAAAIARLMMPDLATIDLTRPSRDGGRDGIGQMRIGSGASAVLVDFALEAKCYHIANPVGVREMSRLISRLRHRQFGILVTTSYVDAQTYREIKADGHPIVIIGSGSI
jgi:Restriction endonuclease AspBHI N-terminal/Restriction endonuclease